MIVGLVGRMGSGKSTVADSLCQTNGFTRVKFADPLKDMLRAIGLNEEQIEGDEKMTPCNLLMGQTPRHAMQTLGTDWGRDMIHPDLWTRLWSERAGQHSLVVADDCRFPNEARTILQQGGKLIRIVPAFHGYEGGEVKHESEAYADQMEVHHEILNDGSIQDLCRTVYSAIWS